MDQQSTQCDQQQAADQGQYFVGRGYRRMRPGHPGQAHSQCKGPGEAFANLRQRNQFASLTNIALVALLAWQVLPRRTAQASARPELLLAAALALLALGNAASASRTGLLQLWMVAALALCWRREQRVALWLTWALACYAIGAVALPWFVGLDPSMHGMFSRLRTGDALCSSRLTLWRNVLDLIAQRPWLGWGWGELDYAHYMTLYEGPRFCDILDNAHNLPLHLAVELGLPVALALCVLVLWSVWRFKPWRETDPGRQLAWGVLALIGMHSMLEFPLWYGPFQLVAVLALVILLLPTRSVVLRASIVGRVQVVLLVAAIAWLFGALLIASDYRRMAQLYQLPQYRVAKWRDLTAREVSETTDFFQSQAEFAWLTTTPVTELNASQMHAMARRLLHYSPEPRVIVKLIESVRILGVRDEVQEQSERFRIAYPDAFKAFETKQPVPAASH